jgi:prepilin-type N-terminal cleavage/methylation domain-containing protein
MTPSGRRGFTLVELIVVIGIVSVMLGIGVGLVARIDTGGRAAVGIVETVLRGARNWAVSREAPARVRIDVAGGTLQAFGARVVGTWHFEDESLEGAFGHKGVALGGRIVPDGFTGAALSFLGEPARSRVEFPVHLDPAFDVSRGFGLDCALRSGREDGGDVLALGESIGLATGDDGSLRAWFAPEIQGEDGERRRGARVTLSTAAGLVRPGRWCEVRVQYDRARFEVHVDGSLAAYTAESAPPWTVEGPLVLSPSGAPFPGAIDALVVSAVTGEERRELPRSASFGPTTPAEIVFAAGGGLDRTVHREPVRFVLRFEDGREDAILVNLHGTVE